MCISVSSALAVSWVRKRQLSDWKHAPVGAVMIGLAQAWRRCVAAVSAGHLWGRP